jgi:hypothetical protein
MSPRIRIIARCQFCPSCPELSRGSAGGDITAAHASIQNISGLPKDLAFPP